MLIINATQIKKGYSGVGVYSIKVIERLVQKFNSGIIYSCLNIFNKLPVSWKLKIKNIPDRDLIRWLWIQLIFPLSLKRSDVLYCPFSEAPVLFGGKLVITVHDLMPLNFPDRHSKKLRYYYSKILHKNLKKAYAIITISKSTKTDILKFFPDINEDKIKVIYNGYEKNIFNTVNDTGKIEKFRQQYGLNKYILYVGRISKIKNVMCLIRAFGSIKDKTNLNLLIIGKDESGVLNEANDYILSSGMEKRISFIERMEEEDISYAYKGSSIFVQPSLSEGFGLPVIEAMACGIPCIISDINVFREVSAGAALMFDPLNEHDLADKILQLTNDQKLYNIYKNKGLERVKAFDWDKTTEDITEILNEAMDIK